MLGPAGYGKSPAILALARVLASSWPQRPSQADAEQHVVCTSSYDSLRNVASQLVEGTPVVLDDFCPMTAEGGRASRLSPDQVKTLFTTRCQTGAPCLGTRYQATVLADGPRLCTSNASRLSEWHSSLVDNFASLTAPQRVAKNGPICPDGQALFKRLLFAFVSQPLLSVERAEEHWAPVAQEHQKRARHSLTTWSRPSSSTE